MQKAMDRSRRVKLSSSMYSQLHGVTNVVTPEQLLQMTRDGTTIIQTFSLQPR